MGAILSLLAWTVVWTIGPKKCIIFIAGIFKAIESLKAGNSEDAVKIFTENTMIFTDSIQSPAADPSDSDQSFYSKLLKTLSLRGDNSISGNNSAGASVKKLRVLYKEAQYNLGGCITKGKASRWITVKAILAPNLLSKVMQGRSIILVGCITKGRGVQQDYRTGY